MSDFEEFDPTVFEEESEEENPQVTEIDTSGGGLLNKPFVNPLLKALMVIMIVSTVVIIPTIIGATFIAYFDRNRKPNSTPRQATNLLESNEQEDIEELKTELAQIEVKAESQNLEAEAKQKPQEAKAKPTPTPTPTPPVETEVPEQPEPVAQKIEPTPPPRPKIAPETHESIYIPPTPKIQPTPRAVPTHTPVKKATKSKTEKAVKNPNPPQIWQQTANVGLASYTANRPVTNTRRQPAQAAVQVAASLPVQKPRSKVIKKTYALTKAQRIRRHLKTNSLAKSNFKTQKRLQIKTVPATEATQPIQAEVARGYGLVINFQPTGEQITQTWISDPSKIVFKARNGVVFVRQIEKLDFPAITRSTDGGTQLVVLTNSQYGSKQYVFRLMPVNGNARYSGIVLKPNRARLIQPQPTSDFTNTI